MTTLLIFDYPKFQEILLNTFQSRNVGVKSVGTEVARWEKCTQNFLHEVLSISQATNSAEGGGRGGVYCISGKVVQWLFYFVKSYRSCGKYAFS